MKKLKNLLLSSITDFSLPFPYITKMIALVVVACFFTSSVCRDAVAVVVMPEIKVLEYKQISNDFVLPYSYGKITKSHFAATDRIVINIQDLHCHPQVQKNISNIIELFDKNYGVSNVYLEGAYDNVSTRWLTENIKNDKEKTEILNKILETGKLTGAEYYSAISNKTEIIKGLEKKEPYLDNLKRFGDLLEKQDEIKLILSAIEKETENIRKKYYKKNQLKLEKLLQRYEQGKINTDKYYFLLSKYANEFGINLAKYKNISNYITLLKLQKQFKLKTVQKELASLLSILKQKLSYQEYSMLISKTDNFKKTDILSDCIMQMLQNKNIDLNDNFSQLDKYFSFVRINKNINPIQLLKEQEQLITKINTILCENKLQKEVVFLVSFEKYLKQYLTAKITPDDYLYYKENIETYKMLWNKYADNQLLTLLNDYLTETDKFYEINIDRNGYFAENIFDGIKTNKLLQIKDGINETDKIINNMEQTKRIDVVVTGGFHSETVTNILEEKDVSYIVITPNIQGGVKEAEQTYYRTAKLQSEFAFQTLATLPFSAYGKNYQIAVAIEAFPKEAEKIFGKAEFDRVKNLIEKGNITVKEEHIKNINKYRKELKDDIDISNILQPDDIELKDLKGLVKKIGNFIFTDNFLSEEDLADITKNIAELMNNDDSNLVLDFFDKLGYRMDMIFFKIVKSSKLNKRIKKENVKTAMKKYLELTDYNFDVLDELFYSTKKIGYAELNVILNVLLDKEDENNHKNKSFIEDNIYLITAVCLNYKSDDLVKVLNLLSEKYKSDKDFIINNPDKLVAIINQQHSVEYLEKILNLFLEKDKEGNYKNKNFVEQNKDFIVTVCKAYKNEDVIKVLNLFFKKNEKDRNFISQFTQDFNFRQESNQNITVLIEQQLPVEELSEFFNILLTKENGNYVYEKFLKEIRSYFFELFFTRYSVVSKDMFNLILEYIKFAYSTNIDVDFNYNLTKSLFDSLNKNIDVLPKEQKEKIIYKLIVVLKKYSEINNVMDTKVKEIRDFLLNNIKPAEQADKQKTNLIAEMLLDSLENVLPVIKYGVIDNNNNNNEISDLLTFIFTNYGSKNKNFITDSKQRERFVKILTSYYFELEKIFESYDDKEISNFDHNTNSFLGLTVKNSQVTFMTEKQQNEQYQERKEKLLVENMMLLFNKINLFNSKEQNIIFDNNVDKAKTILNIISGINDFQLLNNKVKKMFVNGYIITPATLKEYSIDTETIEKNNIKIRKGKNPPLIRNKETAKQRNCNNAEQVAKLFACFVSDKKNNNEENNKIFKEKTGFTIDEITDNFIFMNVKIKNKGAGIYERSYDKFEILEIYADDIVYAIAQIMQQKDTNEKNESFNNLLKQNNIEYNFKCPLFDGPCLIPYSKILNAGYDINDCTGMLAGGLHNVDFRNNRIYTRNHLLYGYYKNGRLVQKYGCDYDENDFFVFSLEDIPGFRIADGNGEYEYADSEGLFFFESMDFILEEKNRIEKENEWNELNAYIETDTSNSRYLQDIAFSITTDEYSSNYNLLVQNEPEKLKKLNSKINFKEKINEAKIIATRNRIIRILTKGEKSKFDIEKDIAVKGTDSDTVKVEDDKIKFKTSDDIMLNNFIKNFITISKEYLSFYETDKNTYAIPINKSKNKFLEIKINEEVEINLNSRFNKLNEAEFNDRLLLKTESLSDTDMEKIIRYLNAYKKNNIIFFNKNKLKKMEEKERNIYLSKLFEGSEIKKVNIIEKEDEPFVILQIKDGENSVYYAEVPVKSRIKQNLSFEVKSYSENIYDRKAISLDKKEELLNKMASDKSVMEECLENEFKKTEEIEIEVPVYTTDYSLDDFLDSISYYITNMFSGKQTKHVNQLIVNRAQLSPQLQKWAKNNGINLMVLDIKYEAVKAERKGNFLLQYRNNKIIRYKLQKDENGIEVLTIFSKEAISYNETGLIMNVLQEEFLEAEIAELDWNEKEIMSNFEKKYNITESKKEINNLVKDNLDIGENIKENTTKTDLIKNILSAA